MNKNVIVAAGKSGSAINVSKNNSEYGYIRVEQARMVISDDSWASKKKVSALINGKVSDLRALNLNAGDKLPGKIRIVERMEPFNAKNPEKDVKVAGESGIICSVDGAPIYRNCFYSPNEDIEDVLVRHDNTEEIQAVIAELNAEKANLG